MIISYDHFKDGQQRSGRISSRTIIEINLPVLALVDLFSDKHRLPYEVAGFLRCRLTYDKPGLNS